MKQLKTRDTAMDVVRCFALLNVIATHFFLGVGFYEQNISGVFMYAMVVARSFTRCCVPLFLILSGYLLRTRTVSGKYYGKITKTVGIYLLCSVCCLLYSYLFKNQPLSPVGAVLDTLCFAAAPYSWYMEMYLGLFLIIPFLNILYNNIGSKKNKQLLLLIFIILTALPDILNIFKVKGLDWWITPSSSTDYNQIFPGWWVGVYPITYYFIGCYLSEYPIKLRASSSLALAVLVAIVAGMFDFYRNRGAEYLWGSWLSWSALPVVIYSVLIFTFFRQLDFSRVKPKAATFWGKLSDWCLGAYLVSWIFDDAFYPILERWQPNSVYRYAWLPVMVIAILICSWSVSAGINLAYKGCDKLCASAVKGLQYKRKTDSDAEPKE